jgi:hypothetical protein
VHEINCEIPPLKSSGAQKGTTYKTVALSAVSFSVYNEAEAARERGKASTVQWAIKERNLLNYNSPSHIRRGRNKKQARVSYNKRTKHNNKANLSRFLRPANQYVCRFY